MSGVKQEAARLIEELPDDATWDDLMCAISVRQAIKSGNPDSEAVKGDVRRLRGMLKDPARRPLTVEEMNEAILRHHAEKR